MLISDTAPKADNLDELNLTTDKAYICTGLCELLFMNTSPQGKFIREKKLSPLINEAKSEGSTGTREEIVRHVFDKYVTGVDSKMKHLYILTPNELFYVCNRSKAIGEAENILVTADRGQIAELHITLTI